MKYILVLMLFTISKGRTVGSSVSIENFNLTKDYVDDLNAALVLSAPAKIIFTCLVSLTFIVSIIGNSLVIHIVRKSQEIKSTTFVLIVNLACADLLTTIVVCPTLVKFHFLGFAWLPGQLGSVLCKLTLYAALVFLLACIFSVVGITIDRYLAVSRPLKHQPFSRWTKLVIPVIWLGAILLPLKSWNESSTFQHQSGNTDCLQGQASLTMRVVIGICYVVPMIIMSILYPIISCRLWARQVPGENSARQQRNANLMARKVTKMMATVVVVFFLCWTPQFVLVWFHPFALDISTSLPAWLIPFVLWLEVLNSSMNPVIYSVFNSSFKRGFREYLSCKNSTGNDRNGCFIACCCKTRNREISNAVTLVRVRNNLVQDDSL